MAQLQAGVSASRAGPVGKKAAPPGRASAVAPLPSRPAGASTSPSGSGTQAQGPQAGRNGRASPKQPVQRSVLAASVSPAVQARAQASATAEQRPKADPARSSKSSFRRETAHSLLPTGPGTTGRKKKARRISQSIVDSDTVDLAKRPKTDPPRPSTTLAAIQSIKRTPIPPAGEAKALDMNHFELETLRFAYARAQTHGGAAFFSIDVEMWERNSSYLLEFGWSSLELVRNDKTGRVEAKRDNQHAVVRENKQKRNGRWSPDNRDNFAFGRTLQLPQQAIYHTLAALLSSLSAHQHVFVIFHDPRGDMRALDQIGFNTARDFTTDLRQLGPLPDAAAGQAQGGKVWVVDTQRLFSAWLNRRAQIGLEKACAEVNVPTRPELLHNAANDAHYTLDLFERMMMRTQVPASDSALIRELDARAQAAEYRKKEVLDRQAKRTTEAEEQQSLRRR